MRILIFFISIFFSVIVNGQTIVRMPGTSSLGGGVSRISNSQRPIVNLPSAAGPTNLILNGDFTNADEWNLLNGSSISGGVGTVVGNGNLGADFDRWSLSQTNIEYATKWQNSVYNLSFDARQTVGNGNLQVSQRFTIEFNQPVTSNFQNYSFQFNGGSESSAGNDINFGGDVGDEFEIDNVVITEVLLGPVITFDTDFETDQWGANGVNPPAGFWEVDHGDPRTTDDVGAPSSSGRGGVGRAIWLGPYNGDPSRNEVGTDDAVSMAEHWIGGSIYVNQFMGGSRIWLQNRYLASGGSRTVNAISIRDNGSNFFISVPDDINDVDVLPTGGAGSNTSSVTIPGVSTGEWIDFVIHYSGGFGAAYTGPDTSALTEAMGFDPRRDGVFQVWINGSLVVDHTGTTAYRYERGGGEITGVITPKIGPYWDVETGQDALYDNYKICQGPECNYAAVDPSQ
ncbi:hypothetical protein [Flagellimonas sp.]|uniref:hypothetical protein n=1 Tax=Flagellimonas sp. TaxID=2058762 RepID=UPI003F49F7FF